MNLFLGRVRSSRSPMFALPVACMLMHDAPLSSDCHGSIVSTTTIQHLAVEESGLQQPNPTRARFRWKPLSPQARDGATRVTHPLAACSSSSSSQLQPTHIAQASVLTALRTSLSLSFHPSNNFISQLSLIPLSQCLVTSQTQSTACSCRTLSFVPTSSTVHPPCTHNSLLLPGLPRTTVFPLQLTSPSVL